MTYIKVYKYSARRWQPGILNVRIRKYFSDSCFGSPEFFGMCSISPSLEYWQIPGLANTPVPGENYS